MNKKDDDIISQHFKWIFNLISRLKKTSTKSAHLLSLEFIENRSILEFEYINLLDNSQNMSKSLPSAINYAILSFLFSNSSDFNEIKQHANDNLFLYQYSILKLLSIGYKPCQPCTPINLQNNSLSDHLNLCMCLEFVVSDKSLPPEKLFDDIKRLPRSFFVLSSHGSRSNSRQSDNFYYTANLEDAVRLWLSKFPCLYDLADLTDKAKNYDILKNSVEQLQEELSDGKHVAAVLSRSFPLDVKKDEILQNDSISNWNLVRKILENEMGGFIPSSFPVTDNLFMCFMSDLFHATRNGAKKFVRIDDQKLNRSPFNSKTNESSFISMNLISNSHSNRKIKQSDSNFKCTQKFECTLDDDQPSTACCTKMIRDSNSIAASIVFNQSKSCLTKSGSKAKLRGQFTNSSSFNNSSTAGGSDEVSEFLSIYKILNDSSNFFNAKLNQTEILSLVHALVKLLHAKNKSDQNFSRLFRILESKKKRSEMLSNGKTLLLEISKAKPIQNLNDEMAGQVNSGFGVSEIDLRASQKVIAFSKTMLSNENLKFQSALKKVTKQGFSIATQTSSMTHFMSFVRDTKSVKVTAYVNSKKSSSEKVCFDVIEKKSEATQTDFRINSKNGQTNWKKNSNVLRFETVSYPYGEFAGGFSRPNSNYSSFRNSFKKSSAFPVSVENGKKGLIRNINQNS